MYTYIYIYMYMYMCAGLGKVATPVSAYSAGHNIIIHS